MNRYISVLPRLIRSCLSLILLFAPSACGGSAGSQSTPVTPPADTAISFDQQAQPVASPQIMSGTAVGNANSTNQATKDSSIQPRHVSLNGSTSSSGIQKIYFSYLLDTLHGQVNTAAHSRANESISQKYTVAIVVTPNNASPMTPVSGSCNSAQCTVNIAVPMGLNAVQCTLSDSTTNSVLYTFTTYILVQPNSSNTFTFTGNPIVNSVSLQLGASSVAAGGSADIPVTIKALDADGNIIVGTNSFVDANGNPIIFNLSVLNNQAGGDGSISLKGPTRITTPGQSNTSLHYDGKWLGNATITLTSSRNVLSANAAVATVPKVVNEYTIPTANSVPWGMVKGNDGNIWFNERSGNKIGRLDMSGNFSEFTVPTSSSLPSEMTIGPDGNIWSSEQFGNKVVKIDPSGTITEMPILGGVVGFSRVDPRAGWKLVDL